MSPLKRKALFKNSLGTPLRYRLVTGLLHEGIKKMVQDRYYGTIEVGVR